VIHFGRPQISDAIAVRSAHRKPVRQGIIWVLKRLS